MPTIISDIERITDLCWGLCFFGTGGGGRVEAGLDTLKVVLEAGKEVTLVDADDLDDDAWTAWAIIVGGKDPDEPPAAEELAKYGLATEEFPDIVPRLVESVRQLSAHTGVQPDALISMELSSAATAATIATGLELGIPTIDGDYVGRAIPELTLNRMELRGIAPTPIAMVDRWGNRILLKSTVTSAMADRFGRMVSQGAYGLGIGTTGHLVQMRQSRPAIVRGSLSKATAVGAVLRGYGDDASGDVGALDEITGGRVLFEAEVEGTEWRDTQPYTFRELDYHMNGVGDWVGRRFRIWVKNEHHAVWRDDDVIATSPDIVAVLDRDTKKPLTTLGDVQPGRVVIVYAVKALDSEWHTAEGQALLGPRHFDLGFDYVDFESVD